MAKFGSKVLLTLIIALAFSSANAAIVWQKGKGWQVEGGVIENLVSSAEAKNALEAMNKAAAAQDDGDFSEAIEYYKIVVRQYPLSIFTPDAYLQLAILYKNDGQFEEAHRCLEVIVKNYPSFEKYKEVIAEEYDLANTIQKGARPYMWGIIPWFKDFKLGIKIYESVVKNAPYSDYAPLALMNIALIANEIDKPEVAIDALDRIINTYPESPLTPDAYLEMAKTYRGMSEGADYDQASVVKAMDFYQDFLILFPQNAAIANAEAGFDLMQDIHARSRLVMGDFYYYYRNNNKAASIFYNQTITIAPKSPAALEAQEGLKKIADGQIAPMTPVDFFFGRYKRPSYDALEDESKIERLNAEAFDIKSAEMFITSPGVAVEEELGNSTIKKEEKAQKPVIKALENGLESEGFAE
ncbi:MAG: tetratricopeptide repeat protein [Opitutales bacterium]|nr:tetratricopeptide repeat protein [Opitutales bacterium]